MSEQSQKLLQQIKERLNATARRLSVIDLSFGLVLLIGIVASLWLLATAVEAGFWLNPSVRLFIIAGVALTGFTFLAWLVLRPLLIISGLSKGPDSNHIAKKVGKAYPQISDKLTNLLNLAEGRRSHAPDQFVDHAVKSLGTDITAVEFEKMGNFDRTLRASRFAAIPLLGLIVFLIAAPGSFLSASARLLAPGTEFQKPAPFQMQITPGDIELIRGDSLTLQIALTGSNLPEQLILETTNQGEEKTTSDILSPDEEGNFAHTFINIRRSFSYRILAGEVESPSYSVEIVERPIIRTLQVSLDFPAYARIPSQKLAVNAGDVQALAGTEVSLDVRMGGNEITEAYAVHSSGSIDTLLIVDNQAQGSFTLRKEGHYQILLRDAGGVENSNPIKYSLRILPDASPTVLILSPRPQEELNESLQTFLNARITDDFGFARLSLFYRLSESRFGEVSETFKSFDLPLPSRTMLDQEINFDWLIRNSTGLDLLPGDVIEYYLQVWDNDSVAGYKKAQSAVQHLRLPSLAEQYEELDKKEDEAQDTLEDLLRESKEVKDQFKELKDELRNKQESDWEDQRQLEQLKEKQAELENKVESLTDTFEDMTNQMEENNLVSDETLQMYEEMQEVLEEINSPELMDALQELQESLMDLDLKKMQESLQNFEFSEEQYQQRMERTLELFKQLRVQQDLEEVAKRAEDLAKQQERMQEETEELKKEQENAEGEQNEGEQQEGEQGEQQEGEQGEQQEGEPQEGEQGEQQEGEQGEQQDGEQGEQQEGEQGEQGEQQEAGKNEELAQKQEMASEEMKQLEEQLQEILQKMQDMKNAPTEQMEQLQEDVQLQEMPEQMQENADQLRQNQLDQAQQQQQQMQQQMQQMQQQLNQMQQNMQGSQSQVNIAGLRRALSDVLTLSQHQEDLREQVRALTPDSPVMRQNAQKQIELSEGLRVVADSLQKLSANIPQMTREVQQHAGDALREMGESVTAMTDRASNRASGYQKESMMHLNELALLLSDLLNELMNQQGSGSGGGTSMQQMLQQLQNAAGQQQKLNQQMQQMLNQMQGNRLSQDMQQRLRQMASQQEKIRSDLKSLSRQRELRGKVMGDLNRIADQMEETIRELQRGRPNRKTIERQQKILTRMLDATKSMQQRGKEQKREGREGEEFFRESPADLTPSERTDQLRRALIQALDSGYAPDYEELIKRYFELLQQKETDQ